jgi:hypothetical protein
MVTSERFFQVRVKQGICLVMEMNGELIDES